MVEEHIVEGHILALHFGADIGRLVNEHGLYFALARLRLGEGSVGLDVYVNHGDEFQHAVVVHHLAVEATAHHVAVGIFGQHTVDEEATSFIAYVRIILYVVLEGDHHGIHETYHLFGVHIFLGLGNAADIRQGAEGITETYRFAVDGTILHAFHIDGAAFADGQRACIGRKLVAVHGVEQGGAFGARCGGPFEGFKVGARGWRAHGLGHLFLDFALVGHFNRYKVAVLAELHLQACGIALPSGAGAAGFNESGVITILSKVNA